MGKFKNQIRILWPGLLIIAAVVACYRIYSNSLEQTKADIEVTLASLEAMNDDLANSQSIVDRYSAARKDLEPYLSTLFPSSRPQALIDEVKKTADEYTVRLADITLDVPKFIEIRGKNETISIVPFELSFRGSFFDLGRFLERLEKMPYVHALSSCGISKVEDSGRVLELSLKGAFRFFSREAVKEIADGD